MKSASDLSGKTVVITGGAGLIGQRFVEGILAHGATAVIADLDEPAGRTLCAQLAAKYGADKVDFVALDIASVTSVQALMEYTVEKHGALDALVNNALPRNEHYGRDFEDVTYDDFCENVSLHLGGYFLMSQQAARVMAKQGQGVIVNMASIYGFMAPRFELYEGAGFTSPVEYSAIKGGVLTLTKYLASYLSKHDIRVNALSPGGVHNNQAESFVEQYKKKTLVGQRMASADDLTGALVFLLSDASSYVTGQNLVVDGGWSI